MLIIFIWLFEELRVYRIEMGYIMLKIIILGILGRVEEAILIPQKWMIRSKNDRTSVCVSLGY